MKGIGLRHEILKSYDEEN